MIYWHTLMSLHQEYVTNITCIKSLDISRSESISKYNNNSSYDEFYTGLEVLTLYVNDI